MHDILTDKLCKYLEQNNPDILISLEEKSGVTKYLSDQVSAIDKLPAKLESEGNPPYLIEEICMKILTEDLRPSKFNYICAVLEEDFETTYYQLQQSGTLRFEAINMITECKPVFDAIGFTEETENNRKLKYAITGVISEYLNKQM
ncbi:MAG TPA: DUF1896 family protein [Panacibacter sp.]|nr:DUF1896 family protein [Panacibacter sp.]